MNLIKKFELKLSIIIFKKLLIRKIKTSIKINIVKYLIIVL